ncbi:MAG: decaprenyl-phosphate phosphoribosyltransferase [Pedococcus sp.]
MRSGQRPHAPPTAPSARTRTSARLGPVLRLVRPHQWIKNALVFAAPAAAGVLDQPLVLGRTVLASVAFLAASAAVYAANDVHDRAADRAHPVKRHRPIANGDLRPSAGVAVAVTAASIAYLAAAALGGYFVAVVVAYLLLSVAYSWRLKDIPVLDLVAVAGGFVLRAVAGAVANGLVASNWFLLISLFGSLYLVVGKRSAEATAAHRGQDVSRPVLLAYPANWLQEMRTVSLSGATTSYAMWAFQDAGSDVFKPILALSVVPFVIVLMRYGLLLADGGGEEPEKLLLSDRMIVAAGLVWAMMVAGGLYAA